MAATFDVIERIKNSSIPASCFAEVAGVPASRLSRYIRGQERCGGEHYEKLQRTWDELHELIRRLSPAPLNFKETERIRECLDLLRRGSLTVVVFAAHEMSEDNEDR